jgi:hypothetical protein
MLFRYSTITKLPIDAQFQSSALNFQIVTLCGSSWQENIDFCYSTGVYLILIQGGIVDAKLLLPQLVFQSSAEANCVRYAHYMLAGSSLDNCILNPWAKLLIYL